ncbi:hypothetical protein EX895_005068 [Sporisorium graminicola]|uniref:Uncharacterized protein n=1 Tax=Sporisorium graminicola TaxID=280036 RepID=A0A4U7KPS4_9BASI|nr:hypothetical protein EX895_005068 [Sporisorium graminicola]TKY86243.1 hypothetical protein EX895_005068 [Sporisorium graminicola]
MPTAIKSPFATLTSAVSKYITSHKARVQAQKQAKGTTSGPTGAEVDAQVASTLSKKQGAQIASNVDAPSTAQVDDQGRTLGLEDPNEPALQDDPLTALRATAQPNIVPTTPVIDPALLAEVSEVTYGAQTSIPELSPPTTTSTQVVDANQYGFVDPRVYSGTSFDLVGDGLHEPLNVIVSSLSSPAVLTRKGLQSYCRALDFDRECLGLHAGGYQKAYVDLRGWRDQEFIYRQVYTPLDHVFGTCIESVVGGNHIRAWQQQASGAWFLATSKEETASKNHMIVPNGYNVGRNLLVKQALGKNKDGKTSFMFTRYQTQVEFIAGLMPQGVQGVNHDIAVDGLTAVLTVTVLPETSWFGAKQVAPETQESHVATGMVAAAAPEDGPVGEGEGDEQREMTSRRERPTSLVKRFSAAPTRRRHSEERQANRSAPRVWQRLKRMSIPKHQPVRETANSDPAVATVDSSSTVAAPPDAGKSQPGGLVTAAPLVAA